MAYLAHAYFLNRKDLINTYKKIGGIIGTFNPAEPNDLHHARRSIFQFIQPAPMDVWYATLDGYTGMVFLVGKKNCHLFKAVELDVAKRCFDVFGRGPDPCVLVPLGDQDRGELTSVADGSVHELVLLEFMQ
ncbi:hypothetical protein FRC11_010220 [Ceratobasidium sp. 423]|nr:hypothetical protein FRC11_010220 [Ceratobasidium sp. 423]